MDKLIKLDYLANYRRYVKQISRWFYKEWKEYYKFDKNGLKDIENSIHTRIHINTLPLAVVALKNNILIGTASLKYYDMDNKKDLSPWLAGVFVAERFRNQGIGKLLINRISEEAKRLQFKKLYLWTPQSKEYYEHLGWKVVTREFYKIAEVFVMEKTLNC